MPIIKSAKKAARQAVKRTEHNKQIKKDIKLAIKEFKKTPTGKSLAKAQSELDKAVKKNILALHTAARRKAALHKIAKANNIKLEKSAKPAAKPAKSPAKATAKKPTTKSAKTAAKSTAKKTTKK